MPPLPTKEIRPKLEAVPQWSKRGQAILRTFKFDGFLKAVAFVKRIAPKAEKMNHHPDMAICFNQVTLTLSTHDEGGITDKDFAMARQCDEMFGKFVAFA